MYIIKDIIESQLTRFTRLNDLVMFTFLRTNGEKVYIHASCFIRIYKSDSIVICTQDMLRRSEKLTKKQKFDWTKVGGTLFDDTVDENRDEIFSARVISAEFCGKDLKIYFNNNMRIEILEHITTSDDPDYSENYRIFDDNKDKEHCSL